MGVYSTPVFPLHVAATTCPGSDTAAWICSGGCSPGGLCASSELVGEGGHWTPLTSLSDLADTHQLPTPPLQYTGWLKIK